MDLKALHFVNNPHSSRVIQALQEPEPEMKRYLSDAIRLKTYWDLL